MKILIDIPDAFEVDYNADRFAEFFHRCFADMGTCCGNFEFETAVMMEKAFAESRLYDPDKVVEQLEEIRVKKTCNKEKCDTKELCRICVVDDAIEIVKQVGVSDDVCEWIKYDYRTICPKNHDANNPYWRIPDNTDKLKYCPYCGKKIKVVE